MLILILLLLQCCLPLLVLGSADSEELSIYPVIMPMIVPAKNEVYLCTSVDLSQTNKTYWIKGFEPKVKNPRIHHMALAGSMEKPPKTQFNIWNCGGNGKPARDPNYPNFGVSGATGGDDTTIYLWGMGGERTMLPPDVGFKVGANSRIKYLVLQVHYINIETIEKEGDASGIYMYYTEKPQAKIAGMLSMHVDTMVPKMSRSYQDVACQIGENKVLHPFALMMHTHRHGKVVSTWRVRRNIAGRDQWSLLDKRDPLIAQHYYPIQDPSMTLVYGDQLAFRCTMVNLGSKDIKQGLASYDEMCDAYLLYYVDSNEETGLLEGSNFCWSAGPPEVSWHNLGLKNIPNRLASSLV